MPKPPYSLLILLLVCIAALSGCVPVREQAFYVSPLNGNAEDYHALPLVKDSAPMAIYARTAFYWGGANTRHNDHLDGWSFSGYAAHHFGHFQCYYGLDLSLGTYIVGTWDTSRTLWGLLSARYWVPPGSSAQLAPFAGDKFYGSTSFSGGINAVMPMDRGGEWRYLGVETSLHREFGDYLAFRKQLPDSLVTQVVKSRFFGTLGLSSEIIGRTSYGEWGFRISTGGVLGSSYNHLNIYDSSSNAPLHAYSYFDLSLHFTFGRLTGYIQMDNAVHATTGRVGVIFRMSNPRLPDKPSRRYSPKMMDNRIIMP
jgi:hypothetical protein